MSTFWDCLSDGRRQVQQSIPILDLDTVRVDRFGKMDRSKELAAGELTQSNVTVVCRGDD
jgi:hypothetical protein